MSRDPAYLLDILIAARLIQDYMRDADRATFESNTMLQDAIARRLEIIDEATRRLSPEFRAAHPEIPWQVMVGMRSRLIHGYDNVNLKTVWDTIQDDIPTLIAQIEPLVPPDEPDADDL
jgi:uncharacterized protein with HEPN domain